MDKGNSFRINNWTKAVWISIIIVNVFTKFDISKIYVVIIKNTVVKKRENALFIVWWTDGDGPSRYLCHNSNKEYKDYDWCNDSDWSRPWLLLRCISCRLHLNKIWKSLLSLTGRTKEIVVGMYTLDANWIEHSVVQSGDETKKMVNVSLFRCLFPWSGPDNTFSHYQIFFHVLARKDK